MLEIWLLNRVSSLLLKPYLMYASAPDSIVNYAESKKADLIVIGTKGRTGLKQLLLGSVASGVVTHASCPVLITR